jgi:hypothetical protein
MLRAGGLALWLVALLVPPKEYHDAHA